MENKNPIKILIDLKKLFQARIHQYLDILINFKNKYEEEKNKLPYNLNLLDEVKVYENNHSKILGKLLQYNKNDDYIILNKFLEHLGKPFENLEFIKPEITIEEDRIDIRISDDTKSIIIENKINNAPDRKKQIERYIENEQEKRGYDFKNIYVLYLTLSGGGASEKSLSKKIKRKLEDRYKEITAFEHIRGWLKSLLELEEIKKENVLYSAIIQYKDFLDGLLYQREGEENMKYTLLKALEEYFGFNENISVSDKIKKLDDFDKTINEIISEVQEEQFIYELRKKYLLKLLEDFESQLLKQKIEGISKIEKSDNLKKFGEQYSGINFYPENWNDDFCISLYFDDELSSFFIGIGNYNYDSNPKLADKLIKEFNKIFGDNEEPNPEWPYGKYIEKDYIYNNISLIEEIENGIFS
ncbi:MAG: hypothetical protein KatS3mg129_2345 [Leptospiraceae bacterium]|nr:MAG: hypothetical protein KatS3mg129_2345 [Leptospiraceae bacterium]